MADIDDRDPTRRTQTLQVRVQEIIDQLLSDVDKVTEPQLRAMFSTAAEVLTGLNKKFKDYEDEREKGWHGVSD